MDKKIRHCRNSFNIQLKNCGKRKNRGKKQNRCLNTQYIHNRSLSRNGTGTSSKSGGDKVHMGLHSLEGKR